ncbi:MAG: flp pilus-assembly TadE/G-like family protein [Pseudonocardia sp.]|nr:flp pilus-assembly TadE/G-like family protein [Pseudonocardia sp.]
MIPRDDRGSATVFAAFASLAILLVLAAGVDVGGAVLARHRAEAAADLAALGAAGRSIDGTDTACALARDLAERARAVLDRCELDGWEAVVQVRVHRSWTLLAPGEAVGRARAGPVPAGPADTRADVASDTTQGPSPGRSG